jgi:hypothetical protein
MKNDAQVGQMGSGRIEKGKDRLKSAWEVKKKVQNLVGCLLQATSLEMM